MYIAVRVVLWHLEHPTSEWGNPPPPLKRFAMPGKDCTSPRTLLDYVRGTGHRPKTWMKPFPLLDGSPAGRGTLILLIVPPGTQATGSHQHKEVALILTLTNTHIYVYMC